VPVALDSAANGTRVATLTLHTAKSAPLAVRAQAGSVALASIVDPGDGLRLVHAGSSVIYQRLDALPRIRWASSAVVVPDAAERVRLLASGTLDDGTVVLDRGAASPASGSGSVAVTSDGTDSVGATVTASAAGYLVVADSDQVGWSASVDGKKAALVPADQGLVAVQVPAGTHTVALRYSSPDGGLGAYASAATLFALAGGVGAEIWLTRRGSTVMGELGRLRGRGRGDADVPTELGESDVLEDAGV
jgi:hypothetical protein